MNAVLVSFMGAIVSGQHQFSTFMYSCMLLLKFYFIWCCDYFVADGAHSFWWGVCPRCFRSSRILKPLWWGITSSTSWGTSTPTTAAAIASVNWAVVGHPELIDEDASWERRTPWGMTPSAPLVGYVLFILCLLGDTSSSVRQANWSTGGGKLALLHRVKVQASTLHRVSEDSVWNLATKRFCRSLVSQSHTRFLCQN
jgi:hypothetical protein